VTLTEKSHTTWIKEEEGDFMSRGSPIKKVDEENFSSNIQIQMSTGKRLGVPRAPSPIKETVEVKRLNFTEEEMKREEPQVIHENPLNNPLMAILSKMQELG
jgi:hypothetical protein